MAKKVTTGTDVYTIRKSGVDVLESHVPNCGYKPEELRAMAKEGYYLYKNGKKVK